MHSSAWCVFSTFDPLGAELGQILLIILGIPNILKYCIWPQIPNTFNSIVFDPKCQILKLVKYYFKYCQIFFSRMVKGYLRNFFTRNLRQTFLPQGFWPCIKNCNYYGLFYKRTKRLRQKSFLGNLGSYLIKSIWQYLE